MTRSENLCERHFYALPDANYNVLGMVNAAGNLVERYSYTPYGQRTVFSHGWSILPIIEDVTGDGAVDAADRTAVEAAVANATSSPASVFAWL